MKVPDAGPASGTFMSHTRSVLYLREINGFRLMSFLPYLHRVSSRTDLEVFEARDAMLLILEGSATTAQIAAFLVGLRVKGETASELLGFAQAMRQRAERIDHGVNGEPILDTCGTGGDARSTFNISTIAAFVTAGSGVRVA